MAKTLLRSGCLDDFLALGENGQTVFDSAFQIRETLRLRKQQAIADVLATPQPNEEGDRVDWYAPQSGNAISWMAASDEARRGALRYLDNCQSSVASLSARCQQAEKNAIRLFGTLLGKALQFPGNQHVYLVDGKPVITFWGFVNLNQEVREDVFACLRQAEPYEPEIAFIPEEDMPQPEPLPARLDEPEKNRLEPPLTIDTSETSPVYSLTPAAINPTGKEEKPAAGNKPFRGWLLPAAATLVAVAAVSMGYYLGVGQHSAPVAATQTRIVPQTIAPTPLQAVETLKNTLPLTPAETVPAPKPDPTLNTLPLPASDSVVAKAPKNALLLPTQALKVGTTTFLNGTWRAQLNFSDPITGKPPLLHYQILHNKGRVRLVRGDGIVCKAGVFSGLHPSGILMIKTHGDARCSDKSRYPMPEVACKTGGNGAAECTARYNGDKSGDKVVPITFRKVSD